MPSSWSYKVKLCRDGINIISLFTDGKKIGLLYDIGSNTRAEDNARLITAAPSMYTLLSKLLYHSELEDWAVNEIEQLFGEIDNEPRTRGA